MRNDLRDAYPPEARVGRDLVPTGALKLTAKQWDVLVIICEGNGTDNAGRLIPADIDEVIERMVDTSSKQGLQFVLRTLIAKGLIRKGDTQLRRDRKRRVYFPTPLGRQICSPTIDESFIETDFDFSMKGL